MRAKPPFVPKKTINEMWNEYRRLLAEQIKQRRYL